MYCLTNLLTRSAWIRSGNATATPSLQSAIDRLTGKPKAGKSRAGQASHHLLISHATNGKPLEQTLRPIRGVPSSFSLAHNTHHRTTLKPYHPIFSLVNCIFWRIFHARCLSTRIPPRSHPTGVATAGGLKIARAALPHPCKIASLAASHRSSCGKSGNPISSVTHGARAGWGSHTLPLSASGDTASLRAIFVLAFTEYSSTG
jgi:hypothetical protein